MLETSIHRCPNSNDRPKGNPIFSSIDLMKLGMMTGRIQGPLKMIERNIKKKKLGEIDNSSVIGAIVFEYTPKFALMIPVAAINGR
jgi:hypothetical protein